MQKFYCNSCENTFFQDASDGLTCPSCGSNSVALLSEETSGHFWKSMTFIISMAVMAVMLLTLVLLPSGNKVIKPTFNISVKTSPKDRLVVTIITVGNETADPKKFEYSVDNGYTWHTQYAYYSEIKRDLYILVREKANPEEVMAYPENPVSYAPVPRLIATPKTKDCNCRELMIISVDPPGKGSNMITIHATLPQCEKLYSITGAPDSYQTDSSFLLDKSGSYTIFVKTANCNPVAYGRNPFVYTSKEYDQPQPTTPQTNYVLEDNIDNKPLKPASNESRDKLPATIVQSIIKPSETSVHGLLIVTFIVETSGEVSHVNIIKGINEGVNSKVKDYLETMGLWNVGRVNGKTVKTKVTLQLTF